MGDSMPETILLVDDEALLRQLVRSILQTHGYTVLEASGGMDAIQICQQHEGPIHLLLTDVFMPEMNGRNLAERVTTLRPHTPVLYMSGSTDDVLVALFDRTRSTALIQKPFTPDALASKVRAALSAPR